MSDTQTHRHSFLQCRSSRTPHVLCGKGTAREEIPRGSKRFQEIPRDSKRFQEIPRDSTRLWAAPAPRTARRPPRSLPVISHARSSWCGAELDNGNAERGQVHRETQENRVRLLLATRAAQETTCREVRQGFGRLFSSANPPLVTRSSMG